MTVEKIRKDLFYGAAHGALFLFVIIPYPQIGSWAKSTCHYEFVAQIYQAPWDYQKCAAPHITCKSRPSRERPTAVTLECFNTITHTTYGGKNKPPKK